MPLKHGKSKKTLQENIKTEIAHGKDPKQAAAIAYSVRRKAMQKMAKGGEVMCAHGGPMKCAHGCYAEGGIVPGVEHPHEGEPRNKKLHPDHSEKREMMPAMSRDKIKDMSESDEYRKFKKASKFAEGGEVMDDESMEGEVDSHISRPDYADELENEPMGNEWHSDEFLADPYGQMTSNHHVEFDPDVEEEEHGEDSEASSFLDGMEHNPKKRLEKIMARRRVRRLSHDEE